MATKTRKCINVQMIQENAEPETITALGRQCPDLPCGWVFEEAEWKSACAVVKRHKEAGEPTLSEFIVLSR